MYISSKEMVHEMIKIVNNAGKTYGLEIREEKTKSMPSSY
jgi:hypothetical protein